MMNETPKKKVLILITKSNWGGAQRHIYDLATSLPKEKFDIEVAAGGNGVLLQKLESAGIKTTSIGSLERDVKASKELLSLGTMIRTIRKSKPDILHLHSPKAGGLGSFAGRLCGVKRIVYTSHGWPFNEPRPLFQKILIKIFSWFTILFSRKVIVLSRREFDQVSRWPFAKRKLAIIANGVGTIEFVSKEDSRAALGRLSGIDMTSTLLVGSIAELHRNKGLVHAIKGLPDLDNLHYVIFGDGEEKTKLLMEITKLGLGKRVHLLGHHDKASTLLKGLDALILPSLKEGLPYTLLEAGLAQIPVIASRVGGIPDLIEHFKDGFLITPCRPSEIKNSITYLIEHREDAQNIAKKFNEKIREQYSLEEEIEKITGLYEAL